MSRRAARLLLALLTVLTVTGLVACGVPRESSTRTLPDDDVPFRLLDEEPEPSPEPTVSGPAVTVPQVFFVDAEDQLVPRPLPVAASGVEAVLEALLRRLREGPTDDQRQQGLGSAFGPDVGLSLAAVTDSTAVVEVTPAEQVPPADRLPSAVGQIVLTLTSVEGVERVVLQQDGQPVPAPLPGGELTAAPLTPADYVELLAPSVTRPEKAVPLPSGSAS